MGNPGSMTQASGQSIWSRGFVALNATQFLGAFNDNAFKLTVILLAERLVGLEQRSSFIALATFVFFLPWVLFSTSSGYIADRVSKRSVIIAAKVWEIGVMGLAILSLWLGDRTLILIILFLMATQSIFFSPAKYGILPEMLRPEELSKGNGVLQMATMVSILLGTAIGGLLFQYHADAVHHVAYYLVVIALVGTCTSVGVAKVPPARPGQSVAGAFAPRLVARELASTWKSLLGNRPLFLTALAISYFWFVGSLFQQNLPVYAWGATEAERSAVTTYLLFALVCGIGLGSVLAGWLSGGKIELGLVPLGSIGLALGALALVFTHPGNAEAPLTETLVPLYATIGGLLFLGVSGGLYIVPLQAYLQQRSPRQDKGKLIAGANWLSGWFMLASAPIFWGLSSLLGPAWLCLVLGLFSLGVTIYICIVLPEFLIRLIIWILTHTVYRIRVVGREHIPAEGPVLLVANHVSYMDGPLLLSSVDRFVRFVMYSGYARLPGLQTLARLMQVIPVAASDGRRAIVGALRTAAAALDSGEVVCIFAEGQVSRHGNMLPFRHGFKRILKYAGRDEVPVVPVYLDRLWGSIFSWQGGKAVWKWPRQIPYPVTITFGPPLAKDVRTDVIRRAVQELGAQAQAWRKVTEPKENPMSLHQTFVDAALRHPRRRCMADSTGVSLTYRETLIRARVVRRLLAARLGPQPAGDKRKGEPDMLGILLPATVGGALANLATYLLGKVPVNLNFTAGPDALASAIRQCRIRYVVSSKKFLDRIKIEVPAEIILMEDLIREVTIWDKISAALPAFLPRFLAYPFVKGPAAAKDDLATVIFSSGSTGEPKGVMLSHHNIITNVDGFAQVYGFKPDECVVGILPLFHSFGFTGTIWLPLLTGTSVAYHPNPLDGATIGKICRQENGTLLLSTPTFLRGYMRSVPKEDFASLRAVITGAEKLPRRVAERFHERYGTPVLEGYGCTELSPVVALNVPDVPTADGVQTGHKLGTVGHPIPGVAVKVVDPDSGEDLDSGEEGLLLVKGPNVMQGYLGQPELTAEVIREGWYRTGDIARIDEDGFIQITDRLARFSKIAGEMVPHGRVEEALQEQVDGKIAEPDERVFAVVGVPDGRKGERLVVLHTSIEISPDTLRKGLQEQGLPNLWLPAAGSFYEVESFPVLGTGKLDLKGLKALALEHAGQASASS